MRSFNVFSNDEGDYKAVKRGWCWPAFFYGSIWALFSGLWLATLLLLPVDFIFAIAGNSASGSIDPFDRYDETARLAVLALFSFPVVVRVVLGIFGNSWRTRKLRKLGFLHVGRVKADGKLHAISICKAETSAPASDRQHAEPIAGRTASELQPPHVLPRHTNSAMPIGLGESRSEQITPQGFPPHWLGWSIAALNVLAVADMPYGYYQLLRLLVTGYMGYLAALYFIRRSAPWAWAFGFVALLYNPIFVITMDKEFHALVNVIVAAAIAWEIKALRSVFDASHPTQATP